MRFSRHRQSPMALLVLLLMSSLVFVGTPVFAQETAMEEDPFATAGDVEINPDDAPMVDLDALTSAQALTVGGSISSRLGGALGWVAGPDLADPARDFVPGVYGEMLAKTFVDARPSPEVRARLAVEARTPDGTNLVWTMPAISEAWMEYTLARTLTLRFGAFAGTMGQGRLVNPGNLLDGLTPGLTLRASLPVFGMSFEGWASAPVDAQELADFAWLARLDGSIDWLSFGAAYRYREDLGLHGSVYGKTVFAGVDLALETIAAWENPDQEVIPQVSVLVSAFWEDPTTRLRLQSDTVVEFDESGYQDLVHASAILFARHRPSGIRPALLWKHSIADGSGQLVAGIDRDLGKHLRLSLGLPWVYGPDTGRWVVANEDPGLRRLALVGTAEFTVEF